jgi:DNA-binding transcriptional LysR family regulator
VNIQHLRYAVEVERTGSITEAAENLYITQPSLSKAIREFESNCGVTIFERTPRGVIPTAKGRSLLEHARLILKQVAEIESLARDDEPDKQTFSISIPRGSYIAEGVARFAATLDFEKPLSIKIRETNSVQTIDLIADGRFNMGIIRYPVAEEPFFMDYVKRKGMKTEPIWEFEYVVLASSQSPLAYLKTVEEPDLRRMVEIFQGDVRTPYLAAPAPERGRAPARQAICAYERSTQFELLANIPNTYLWVSPVPPEPLLRYSLVQRRCDGVRSRHRDALVYHTAYKLSDCDRRFIDKLFEAKNKVAFTQVN